MEDKYILISLSPLELTSIIREAVATELSKQRKRTEEKELLNFKETCEFLGIHPSTLNLWKRQNKIPFLRMGKRVFFNRTEVISSLKKSNYAKMKELGL